MAREKKLDDVDIHIMALLAENARISLSELGRKVGLSHVTVRERLLKLKEEQFIKPYIGVNPSKLNLEIVVVLIETENSEKKQEIVNTFKNCPRIIQLTSIIGEYDLMAIVYAENKQTLETILTSCVIRTFPGIRRSNVLHVGTQLFPPFMPIRLQLTQTNKEVTPCNLNCKECEKFQKKHCLGCPATKYYDGKLKDFLFKSASI